MTAAEIPVAYQVDMGFTSADRAYPDPERPPLLRARPRPSTPYGSDDVDMRRCRAVDLSQDSTVQPDLCTFGFDTVDLASHDVLQAVLAEVDEAGHLTEDTGSAIRSGLDGATLTCSSGRSLKVLFVADEGLIMRLAGPNRLRVGSTGTGRMNGHTSASAVHADQDVHGTPLVQLMGGRAPTLFRHDSPDGFNHDAELMLVNMWIPLHQITQPLVLGDGRSVDRLQHQLRLGLATESFLDRDEEQTVNDIWAFLPHPDQRWYFHSQMDHRRAYVFDTLSTPHGSAVVPGEAEAERLYQVLDQIDMLLEKGASPAEQAADALDQSTGDWVNATPALDTAVAAMRSLVAETADRGADWNDRSVSMWRRRAAQARRAVVRRSVELRMVVSIQEGTDQGDGKS